MSDASADDDPPAERDARPDFLRGQFREWMDAVVAAGKMRYRESRRSHILALLIDKKFKPVHDRIQSAAIATTIRGIAEPVERKHAARVFLELFRLLHYLDYADPARADEDQLKNTIL